MDNTEHINTVEWFFGYGGNHLGIKRVLPNLRLIAACEIESYPLANMVAKMENGFLDSAPIWTDCKTFPTEPFKGGRVDLFIASYPCQPFSTAGKRKGADDERHLWPYVREFVRKTRPGICFFENVEGHVSLGLREVLTDLADLGYRVESDSGEPTWGIFSAVECGAPHHRKRVFILAYRDVPRVALCRNNGGVGRQSEPNEEMGNRLCEYSPGNNQRLASITATGAIVAKSCQQGLPKSERQAIHPAWRRNERRTTAQFCCSLWPSRPGEPQYEWEEPRVFDGKLNPDWVESLQGVPKGWTQLSNALPGENRIDRLRLLGNGVVPATAEKAFITLLSRIKNPGRNIEPVETQMELF